MLRYVIWSKDMKADYSYVAGLVAAMSFRAAISSDSLSLFFSFSWVRRDYSWQSFRQLRLKSIFLFDE